MAYHVNDKTKKWVSDNSTNISLAIFEKEHTGTGDIVTAAFDYVTGANAYTFNGIENLVENLKYIGINEYSEDSLTTNVINVGTVVISSNTIKVPRYVWEDYAEYVISNASVFSEEDVKKANEYITKRGELSDSERKKRANAIIDKVNGKTVNELMKENLQDCLNSMSEMLNKNCHYTPFVVLKLVGYDNISDTKTKAVNVTLDTRNNTNNIATYFSYKRNGTAKANELLIEVVFSPHERAKSLLDEGNYINPNTLETVLTQICIANASDKGEDLSNTEQYTKSIESAIWSCKLQVGYMVDGKESIVSPEYDTMITDYKCEFQNNMLMYSIQGVSTILKAKTYQNFTRKHRACTEEPIQAAVDELLSHLDKEEFHIACGDLPNGQPIFTKLKDKKISKNSPDSVISCTCTKNFRDEAKYRLKLMEDNGETTSDSENQSDLEKQIDNGIPKGTKEESLLSIAYDYLNNHALLRDDYLKNWKGHFTFSVLDNVKYANNKKTKSVIYIQFQNETGDFSVEQNIDSTYTFQWLDTPTPDSLVENFKLDASGAYIKAAINSTSKGLMENLYAVSSDGNPIKLSDTSSFVNESGDYLPWYKIIKENIYKTALRHLGNYQATLTLPGVPAEIPILTTFRIDVYMNGIKHFSSGYYRVLEIEDILDTGGYKTVLKLLKLTENIDTDELELNLKKLIKSLYTNLDLFYLDIDADTGLSEQDASVYAKLVLKNKKSKLYKYWQQQYKAYTKMRKHQGKKVSSFEDYIKSASTQNTKVPKSDKEVKVFNGTYEYDDGKRSTPIASNNTNKTVGTGTNVNGKPIVLGPNEEYR